MTAATSRRRDPARPRAAAPSAAATRWLDGRDDPAPEIDPTAVPVYPVLRVTVDEAGATLNGRPVAVPDDATPHSAAMTAACAAAAALPGGGAVRVVAHADDGTSWRMAVTGDGRVRPLPDPRHPSPGSGSRRPRRPPRTRPPAWRWPAAAAAVALALGGGATAGVLHIRASNAATAPAPAALVAPVGAGANVPVTPPPGYAARATWSQPIRSGSDPVVGDDGTVLAVAASGAELLRLDPATGVATWAGVLPRGAGVEDLHLTRIDKRPAAAVTAGGTLLYWPLPPAAPTPLRSSGIARTAAEPRAVDLPQQADVTWAGSSPLVELPDQTAAVVTGGALRRLDVPVGAAPLAADATEVTAADPAGRIWRLSPGRPAPRPAQLTRPADAEGPPLRTVGAAGGRVGAVWDGPRDTQIVALHDTRTGRPVAAAAAPARATPAQAELLEQRGGPRSTLGPVLLDPTRPAVQALGAGVAPLSIVPGHVYGLRDRAWVDVTTTGRTAHVDAIDTVDAPGLPAGLVTRPPVALIAADKVEQRLLYALPRQPPR